jgi:hypothetical protein
MSLQGILRGQIRRLDDLIREKSGVFEFSYDPDCLLRLQVARLPRDLQLPDLSAQAGEPVLLLHVWNERLPTFSPGGPDLAWARRFLRLVRHSFGLVAAYMQDETAGRTSPELSQVRRSVRLVGGVTILLTSGLHEAGSRFVQDMGFTVIPYASPLGRFGEFWENFYSWMIIWTFYPSNSSSPPLNDRPSHLGEAGRGLPLFRLHRSEMWMSRQAFVQRFHK